MPSFLLIALIGAAAGFLATRVMRVQTDVPTTVVIGIAGAVIGWVVLRLVIALTGWIAVFAGAVAGAVLLIWLWQQYGPKGRR
ncbi:MAG: GlsB/YeaQ/YmgE family stress response membrane protein [Gemmobacter sp.]